MSLAGFPPEWCGSFGRPLRSTHEDCLRVWLRHPSGTHGKRGGALSAKHSIKSGVPIFGSMASRSSHLAVLEGKLTKAMEPAWQPGPWLGSTVTADPGLFVTASWQITPLPSWQYNLGLPVHCTCACRRLQHFGQALQLKEVCAGSGFQVDIFVLAKQY